MVFVCRGAVAALEKDDLTAKKFFLDALDIFERTRNLPFREGHILKTKARLCCVLARQSELAAAKKQFAEAKTYLESTDESELLEECKRALQL